MELSLHNPLEPGVKSWMKMLLEQRRIWAIYSYIAY